MKNLKKVCALVLSLAMIVSSFTMSFAAEDTMTDADKCAALGMLKGDGDEGVTEEYLAKSTTRFQAALMFLRLQDLEDEALAFEGTENFEDAEDLQWVVGRNALAYLKANPELGWVGFEGKINPNRVVTAQEYYKVMLEALGYEYGEEGDFTWDAVLTFAEEKGLKAASEVENFTNNDIAAVTVETLNAENSEGVKLIDALIEKGAIDEAKAVEVGLVEVSSEVAVKSAVALNSKVIKVTLKEAAENVSLSQFTIVDKDATPVEIADVELAPWDAENKTVLITLAEDSTSGNLYTVTSGEVSVNFGGKAKDETKPAIESVSSNDYNEMTITFKEAVRIDGLTVKLAKKYADKAELATMDFTYLDEKTVIVKTDDQAASTLYGVEVEGAVDLAGNTMDKDDDKSFVGTKKDDSKQAIKEAKALDYNKVYVDFKTKVDFDTLNDATFKLEKAYGTATELQVLEVRQATTTETAEFNSSNDTTAEQNTAIKTGVVLMVEDMKASTLYKVTVEGVGTLYGQPMSTTTADKNTSFVGMAKPSGKFKEDGDVKAVSATTIDVKFQRKVEKDLAEDIANYDIKKAYGDNAELEVLAAEVKTDGYTVRLTVGEMKNSTLYKLTVTNLKDIYGNDQDKIEPSFVGQGKQTKITKVTISRTGNDTEIVAKFDKSVGDNATDVALYFINNGVGYPESVALVDDDPTAVKLTIPKTTDGRTYELAVKGLNNADAIAMDADGVKGTFVGRGLEATLPQITGAVTLNNKKMEIYFDRDVTDSTVQGKIWDTTSATDKLDGSVLTIVADYANNTTPIGTVFAYQNPQNKNSLIVVGANDAFAPVTTGTTYDKLILTGRRENIKGNSSTTDRTLTVATSVAEAHGPKMIGVVAMDKQHLEVHFDQPVGTITNPTGNFRVFDVAKDNGPVELGTVTYRIDPNNATKVDLFTQNEIEEPQNSSDKDNQFVLEILNVTNVKGIDGLSAKHDQDTCGYQTIPFAGTTTERVNGLDTGIYGVFTDDRTLEVMFPQAMDSSSIVLHADRFVVNGYQNSTPAQIAVGKYVTYSAKDNKAVVYFNTPVVLGSSQNEMKLQIATDVKTTAGINVCKDKSNTTGRSQAYETLVAQSSTEVAAPGIDSLSVDDDRTTLTVKMDKMIVFGSTVDYTGTGLNDILTTNDQTFTSTDAKAIAKNFNLNALFGDDASVDNALNNYVTSVVRKSDNKTLEFTLSKALKKGSEVRVKVISYVKFDPASSSELTYEIRSINNKVANTGSNASSSTTGVASSPLYDSQKPQFQGATIDTTKKIVTLIFDEDIVSKASDLKAQVTSPVLGASDTVAISGNKLVITFENALTGSTVITVEADALKDTSTNNLGTAEVNETVAGAFPVQTNNSTANDLATLNVIGTTATSDDETVATVAIVDEKIAITSVAVGSATISVDDDTPGNEATIAVTVNADGTITIGLITKAFLASTNNSTANDLATLNVIGTTATSDDETVATVAIVDEKIAITSVAVGSATISVDDDTPGNEATIAVTVDETGAITIGVITKAFLASTDNSTANDLATLNVVGTTASSDAEAVATVAISADTTKIVITSVSAGAATISVTDGVKTATIAVTVDATGAITIGVITPAV
ncbi:hypothetical protein AN1V17_14910 [Vallitalea sediminicola]